MSNITVLVQAARICLNSKVHHFLLEGGLDGVEGWYLAEQKKTGCCVGTESPLSKRSLNLKKCYGTAAEHMSQTFGAAESDHVAPALGVVRECAL